MSTPSLADIPDDLLLWLLRLPTAYPGGELEQMLKAEAERRGLAPEV